MVRYSLKLTRNPPKPKVLKQLKTKLEKLLSCIIKQQSLLNYSPLSNILTYFHQYVDYAKIASASTQNTKLKKISYSANHAASVILNENCLSHSQSFFQSVNA